MRTFLFHYNSGLRRIHELLTEWNVPWATWEKETALTIHYNVCEGNCTSWSAAVVHMFLFFPNRCNAQYAPSIVSCLDSPIFVFFVFLRECELIATATQLVGSTTFVLSYPCIIQMPLFCLIVRKKNMDRIIDQKPSPRRQQCGQDWRSAQT